MRLFKAIENKAVSDLIREQREKETVDIYRRGWCISEATCALEDPSPQDLIRMAEAIYDYVYGESE